MIVFFYIVITSFIIWVVRNTLYWVYLWQLKEYRLDRTFIHLKETYQGRLLFLSPLNILKFLLLIAYTEVVLNPDFLLLYEISVGAVFIFEAFVVVQEATSHLLKRPIFTIKAVALVVLTLSVVLLFLPLFLIERYLWIVVLDRVIPFVVLLFVSIFSLPSEFYKDIQIGKAVEKLKKRKDILVIGVTGSYGKSSTKEYIAQILSKKFNVLKTQGTNNTPIGIAATILKGLRRHTEIFIVEMGMYKRGEIVQMCQMVHPKIGILTSVNEQHLSLSGNLETTMLGKYELMESLPKEGLALFNGNNENSRKLYFESPRYKGIEARKTKAKRILFQSFLKSPEDKADITAYNIVVDKSSVSFNVAIGTKIMHLKAPLLGIHTIENILPGIYVADYLGMTDLEIKKSVASLSPLPKTMVRQQLKNGVSIIDDTFNANPQAVLAAISYAKVYKGRKILILQPMIELGRKSKDEHYRVGKQISKVCDYLFLTNKNYYKSILKGILDGGGKCIVKVAKPAEIFDFINRRTTSDDIVIFEGKEAAFALERIL